jgi:diaminopimelate epimerase
MFEFSKYHGTGNDFIMVEDLEGRNSFSTELVAALCDRRFGVGGDGLIRVTRPDDADFFMDYYNADGSAAEMCGNGIRCLGKFAHDRGLTEKTELAVDTRAGVKHLSIHMEGGAVSSVTVDMGSPVFAKADIPMRGPARDTFLMQDIHAAGRDFNGSAVSMGNPHLVLFVEEDPGDLAVEMFGAELEVHEMFPRKANIEFAHVYDGRIDVRVWERGIGETMSCGTGACAVLVTASEAGLIGASAKVKFPGGLLSVERTQDGSVLLTGPAEHVFDGTIDEGWFVRGETR